MYSHQTASIEPELKLISIIYTNYLSRFLGIISLRPYVPKNRIQCPILGKVVQHLTATQHNLFRRLHQKH